MFKRRNFYFLFFIFLIKLCGELDKITDQDERIKTHLNRRERINKLIKNNVGVLEDSLNKIEELNMHNKSAKRSQHK